MIILGFEVLWCVFGTLVQDGLAHMRGVICSGKVQNRDEDGLAHMRGVTWRAVPAKFKTDV